MTNNTQRAEALADVYQQIADLQLEAKSILDDAKDSGEDVKALRKVAKELITDSSKLQTKYDEEGQLEMFREAVQIYKRKGLVGNASTTTQGTPHAVDVSYRHLDG
jgi:uncharacterized protein (UPF0335 family)